MHKKGTNNWRAIDVDEDEDAPLDALKGDEAVAVDGSAEGKGSGSGDGGAVCRSGKELAGDLLPKYGFTCRITSSGKNFSFADDCIFIRNELRDACGIKGLWVGDVVTVDATYNHLRRNWVASSVVLVRRNNTGFNMMQDAISKMQEELLKTAGLPIAAARRHDAEAETEALGEGEQSATPAASAAATGARAPDDGAGAQATETSTAEAAVPHAAHGADGAAGDVDGSAHAAEDDGGGNAAADGEGEGKQSQSAADVVASMVKSNPVLSGMTAGLGKQDDLTSVLRDPNVLQTLISALQKQKSQQMKPHESAAGLLERQEVS
jgi:hypothetical protein